MENEYELLFAEGLQTGSVKCGLVWAEGIRPTSAGPLPPSVEELLRRVGEKGEAFVAASVRERVRGMLRYGKYKPSGRAKPASEFLLRAALNGEFPRVNGPVDVNNAISLESGLPASIFDAERSGRRLLVRRGEPGESYVFNPSGQTIDLEDLLSVCRRAGERWEPCGNPVKDSMQTKIGPATADVVAVLYAPPDEPTDALAGWGDRFAALLSSHCAATRVGFRVHEA
jgi:DNA/RNA-binding domain of Phe-tRNA-synthetase-like protein